MLARHLGYCALGLSFQLRREGVQVQRRGKVQLPEGRQCDWHDRRRRRIRDRWSEGWNV
jgi:hypothetical protein